jgi:ADP-ribose pyrophosphatase YjhB (NUDIX family)
MMAYRRLREKPQQGVGVLEQKAIFAASREDWMHKLNFFYKAAG